jgi:hypothetical protein
LKRLGVFALFMAIATSPALFAQSTDKCSNDETIDGCFARIEGAVQPAVAAAKAAEAETNVAHDLATANTGVQGIQSPLGSSLKDFLTFFTAAVDSSMLKQGNDGSLTLDWNLGSKQFTTGRPLKFQAVFNKPQLNPRIKAGLTGDLLQKTEGSLGETDDTTVSLAYSPQNRSIGRALAPHRHLFELLLDAAEADEVPLDAEPAFLDSLANFSDQPPFKDAAEVEGITFGQIEKDGGPEARNAIEAHLVAAAHEQLKASKTFDAALKKVGVDKFRTLLGQQPQAYASVTQRSRNELVGPDELSFKLTYETGGQSLKDFYRSAKDTCDDARLKKAVADKVAADACLDAWRSFLADEKTTATLASSARFAFSVEYTGVRANKVEIPIPDKPSFIDSSLKHESLIGSLTAGMLLTEAGPDTREGRVDFTASYENVTGDKNRDNRFVVSAVYSQKISATMSIPFGVVYANHSEDSIFKEPDHHRVSLHFGLIYKLPMM